MILKKHMIKVDAIYDVSIEVLFIYENNQRHICPKKKTRDTHFKMRMYDCEQTINDYATSFHKLVAMGAKTMINRIS